MPTRQKCNIRFVSACGNGSFRIVRGSAVTHSFPWHIHEHYCIGTLTSGAALLETREGTIELDTQCIYLINPLEPHRLITKGSKGFDHTVVCFGRECLGTHTDNGNAPAFITAVMNAPAVRNRILCFTEQAMRLRAGETDMALAELHRLARPLLHIKTRQGAAGAVTRAMQEVAGRIREHPAGFCTIGDLAELAYMSPFHFCRQFKKAIGITPHDFLIQMKIKCAQSMLLSKNSTASVAAELGFSDQSHFSRFFKRDTGVSPARFVKESTLL